MSWWTYVNGNIVIDTFEETDESIQNFFKALPETCGSEGGCEYHINILDGHNVSTYDNEGNPVEYQTKYSVSIIGSLRDTYLKEIKKDIQEILQKISQEFFIDECCIHAYDLESSMLFIKDGFKSQICCYDNIFLREFSEIIELE